MKTNKLLLILLGLLVFPFLLSGQYSDYNWIIGNGDTVTPGVFGAVSVSFDNEAIVSVSKIEHVSLGFRGWSHIVQSDEAGNLQFYSNGRQILNFEHETILGAEDFNENDLTENLPFLPINNGIISFPHPNGIEGLYFLVYLQNRHIPGIGLFGSGVYFSLLDMNDNNGLGALAGTANIVNDTITSDGIAAVKHGNGRDWWVLQSKANAPSVYTMLFSADWGIQTHLQDIDLVNQPYLDEAIFTPDGSKYIIFKTSISPNHDAFIDVFDFNRCDGNLENQQRIIIGPSTDPEVWFETGLTVSPNSRFVYVTVNFEIYQYDLWADDIAASKEIVATAKENIIDALGTPYTFNDSQLGPDGKIYYIGPGQFHDRLSVMHNPNAKGIACHVAQASITTPYHSSSSLPNFSNVRLGPLDGSPCDTLGLDNIPLANFNHFLPDTTEDLTYTFVDNTAYAPTEWQWTVEGTDITTDDTFDYTFPAYGSYEVCVTASNANGSDTYCRIVTINQLTDTEDIVEVFDYLRLSPNPVSQGGDLLINVQTHNNGTYRLEILNTVGQLISTERVHLDTGQNYFETTTPNVTGMYWLQLLDSQGARIIEKFVVK